MKYLLVILLGVWLITTPSIAQHSTYYYQKRSHFESLPDTPNEIIFLGNSITDGCNWSELFNNPNVKNRGISGDITQGVLDRLDEVTSSYPMKIFIMIGVNDLARGYTVDQVVNNQKEIVARILESSPETKIYLQSILPVNDNFRKFSNHIGKGDSIQMVNDQLSRIASDLESVEYIDLHTSFLDTSGKLDSTYTNDGLHLTAEGYKRWKSVIEDKVVGNE
jgi:lysophospholipase L1-like esterase